MNDYQENLDLLETSVEFFDSEELPSLEDLIRELESDEEFEAEAFTTPELTTIVELAADDNGGAGEYISQSALEIELKQAYQRLFENEQEKQELTTAVARVDNDFKKYRWRAERERTEHYTFAVVAIVREFLPILDNLNRALRTAENLNEVRNINANSNLEIKNFSNFVGGIELIYQQTIKFLTDLGVEEIKGIGQAFDPNVHEAVSTEPKTDVPPNTITEEVLRGYRLGDKLIRAAMVKVSTSV